MNFIEALTDFIFVGDEPRFSDIIFVAGNTFPESAERAARLYLGGYAPFVMPSGKFSISADSFAGVSRRRELYSGDYKTEFEFLKDVLKKNGVPEEAILKEDEASYTWENAKLSRKRCEELSLMPTKAIICCKPAHARRCLMYYQAAFPDTDFIVCPAEGSEVTKENWFLSGEGIKTVLGEAERIGTQFDEIIKERFLNK